MKNERGDPAPAREAWATAALLALALALRLWLLGAASLIETDGVRYVEISRRFVQSGSPFDPLFHPLYPMCVAALQPLVGDHELAGRLVSALFGTALLLPAMGLARRALGPGPALLAGLLIAVHPGLVHSSAAVLSEATYTFWIVLGVWAGWRGLAGPRPGFLPASGLCFGIAYLARPEAAIYAAGLAVASAWAAIRSRRVRELGAWGLAALASFFVPALPYLLYLRSAHGFWTLSGKVLHNFVQDTGATSLAGRGDLAFVLAHPGAIAQRLLENAYLFEKYALPDLFPGLLILLVLPGLLRRPRPADAEGLTVLLAACLPPLGTLAFHVESRVFLPALPFLLPLAGAGLLAAAGWMHAGRVQARTWLVALTALVVAALAPYTLRPVLRPDAGAALYRHAAHWVAATQAPDAVIMDRKPFVAFYSGRRFAPLPRVSASDLAAVARRSGARLVILDRREFGDRPELYALLYAEPRHGLDVLQEFDAGPAGRLRILGVRRDG
jgi:4-amino-4-deoxy-L-arabinose transferase-like glycosyltransferase